MVLSKLTGILVLLAGALLGQGRDLGPSLELNPARAYVLLYPISAPDLKFYRNRDLTGLPAIRLNERGAFVGEQLVCSWPGGWYDESNAANMVLGYSALPETGKSGYEPCPTGFPIISTWADRGLGTAALLIEVSLRKGAIIEVTFAGEPYYLDLRSLPGNPRQPDPALERIDGGALGWEWLIPADEAAEAAKAAADQLRRSPAFARFLSEARDCVASSRAPQCVVPLVQDKVYFPEAGLPDSYFTPEQFATVLWKTTDDGHALWRHLRECFVDSELSVADGMPKLLGRSGWTCELQETSTGWKLARLFRHPAPVPSAETAGVLRQDLPLPILRRRGTVELVHFSARSA